MPVDVYQECWPIPPGMERTVLEVVEAALAKLKPPLGAEDGGVR